MLNIDEKFLSHYYELRRAHGAVSIRDIANLAVILRQFIKDGFIHKVNREPGRRAKLLFPVDLTQDRVSKNSISLADYLSAAEPVPGRTPLKLLSHDKFLAFKILSVSNVEFSVSEIVDIVANKMGNAHYNPDQAIELGLDPFDPKINRAIKNSILRICKSVAKGCQELVNLVFPLNYAQCMGHWDADEAWSGNQHLLHEGHHWMEADLSPTAPTKGLSIFLAATLLPIRSEDCVVTSIKFAGDITIQLGYDWKGDLFFELVHEGETRRISFDTSGAWGTIGKVCVYSFKLEILEDCISGSLSIISKGQVIFKEAFGDPANGFCFDAMRIVFGADQSGENGARMKLNELSLFGCHDGCEIERFGRYMMAKYELA